MLPCLECAAFRTWVMPRLCNVFRFCATALGKHITRMRTQTHKEKTARGNNGSAVKQANKTNYFLPSIAHGQFPATGSNNARHSHVSYVQVGPDFIHWCELQRGGIQDVLQLFNEPQLLLLFAPWHSQHRVLIQHSGPAVCARCPVTNTVWAAQLRDTSRWPFECRSAPKLDHCVQWLLSLGGSRVI